MPPIPIPEIERRILDALEKPFPATERGAEKPTFRDAVARMAKLLPVPVDFDTKHLEDASIDLAIEVELPQGNRTIGSVLEAVLSSAPQPLVWTAHNEALTITTAEASRPNAGHAGLRRDRSRRRCRDPRGQSNGPMRLRWSTSCENRISRRREDSLLDAVNVDERALIVASLSRKAHRGSGGRLDQNPQRRREAVAPCRVWPAPAAWCKNREAKSCRLPIKATKAELAALEQLSKGAPRGPRSRRRDELECFRL